MGHTIDTEFIVPSDWTQTRLKQRLGELLNIRTTGVDKGLVYYDTFDWRVFATGWSLEYSPGSTGEARLRRHFDNALIVQQLSEAPPPKIEDWPQGAVKYALRDVCGLRALLPLVELEGRAEHFAVLNADAKTVCRLAIERWSVAVRNKSNNEILSCRIRISPMRGWAADAEKVSRSLDRAGFLGAGHSLQATALSSIGRVAGDYTPKFKITLDSLQTADHAAKTILKKLFEDMKRNEDGTRRDLDSEFLHDYRVAVRRTRSALSQFKTIFDNETLAPFKSGFRILGQVTGDKRDLDVHLIDFDSHISLLPMMQQRELLQLRPILEAENAEAGKSLAKYLSGTEYRAFKKSWQNFLNRSVANGPEAGISVKQYADRSIWKVYQRILRDGGKIKRHSPDEKLHDLRKLGKKLRYLIEFYQSLYPGRKVVDAIKLLKQIQDQLGIFQDQCVQIETLENLAGHEGVAEHTAAAIGHLTKGIARERDKTHAGFKTHFQRFADKQNRVRFAALFEPFEGGAQ